MCIIKNSLQQSHDIIMKIVKEGDVVIDATAGNGHDTAFLASLVGSTGKVYSFDIQSIALDKTKKRLSDLGLIDRVSLINDSHSNLDMHVKSDVKAVMFNLGYLPGGDHSLGTRGQSTVDAITKSLNLLKVSGLMSIVVYYGGDSGFDEKNSVLGFVNTIDSKAFTVMKSEFVNQPNCPPILILIEKIK